MINLLSNCSKCIGSTIALVVMTSSLLALPGHLRADEKSAEDKACEFSFYPDTAQKDAKPGDKAGGRFEVSPNCEFYYFPDMSESDLATNEELWKKTGNKSHFRISKEGNLLFFISRDKN